MPSTPTANFGYNKPEPDVDTDWPERINEMMDLVDADLAGEHNHEGGVATHGGSKPLRCQVVADVTARTALSAREGDLVWQSDTDEYYVYSGTDWILINDSMTGSEILAALAPVDGSGSGLDADLLDGNHASAFASASHTHATATSSTDGFMSAADKSKLDGIGTHTISTSSPSWGNDGDIWFKY